MDAFAAGQYATTAMNAANEVAVQAFLDEHIKFTDIAQINRHIVEQMNATQISCIDDVLAIDQQARALANEALSRFN